MTEPVRVMLLLSSLHGGGAERVAAHLASRCDPAVLDVRVALLRRAGPFLDDVDPARIDVSPIGAELLAFEGHNSDFYKPGKLLAASVLAPANIAAMIRARRPHVVMSFLKGMSVLAYFVVGGMRQGRPRWIVREGNNTDLVIEDELSGGAARALIKGLTRRCYRAADCFLANSHEMAEGLTKSLELDPARVRVIHNPIDLARIRQLARQPLEAPVENGFILTVGRLEHQKGHDILLRAYAASPEARRRRLVIIGRGTREAALKRLAGELGITERVDFLGWSANPWAWMARASLFVLPSRWEGFPSVVAEALACGLPSLVTACDFGPREVVEHGVSGWVVPPEDPHAFAAAMEMLLADPGLRVRLRTAGLARAPRFAIEPMVTAYTRLFLEEAARLERPAAA